ncbi:hypothetical protein QIS99_21005 [Streptomyces sp. B-S-A8]|uniref:Uncharacterized protein n=1 Tax=Streptomyces solicavernae TaxID=3043614 RepID=A0ABT6RWE7_9ACTN|nr:hypothetical protein [Streptomyces sp. B-S-A8]MDI3388665.1 hypothetical protein [Streptomyces sp. B-S-A8]
MALSKKTKDRLENMSKQELSQVSELATSTKCSTDPLDPVYREADDAHRYAVDLERQMAYGRHPQGRTS